VQLPFPGATGSHSGTCLASTPSLLAVGSQSGSVSVYRAEDMHLLHVVSPTAWTEGRVRVSRDDLPNKNKEQRFAAGGKVSLKARPRPSDSSSSSSSGSSTANTSAVLAMEFTCGGGVLLVLHGNGVVTATNTAFSGSKLSHGNLEPEDGHRDVGERERSRERERDVTVGLVTSLVCPPAQKDGAAEVPLPLSMVLATCTTALHSGHIFAVIRGNIAKVYKVSLPSSLDPIVRSTGDH
jgi:hypothetical protein